MKHTVNLNHDISLITTTPITTPISTPISTPITTTVTSSTTSETKTETDIHIDSSLPSLISDTNNANEKIVNNNNNNDIYLARAGWWSDGSVMSQIMNRNQNKLQLLRIDPITGITLYI